MNIHMKNANFSVIQKVLWCLILFISLSQVVLLFSLKPVKKAANSNKQTYNYKWPPIKVFVYENYSRHTSDCLYPPELPSRYVNETGFWFQRMLEPTIHRQFLESPILAKKRRRGRCFLHPALFENVQRT
jgi:hypothetical protein